MAGRGCAQRQTVASTYNAVFTTQHLDGSHVVVQPHYCFHILHHTSLAGRPSSITHCEDSLIPLQAIVAVSLIGICWAVACWVPFAIIMEVSGLIQSDTSAWYLTPLLASSSKNWIVLRPKASCALRIAAPRTPGPLLLQIFLGLLFSVNVSHYSLGAAHSRIKRITRTPESPPVLREGRSSVSIIWPLSSRNSL